MPSRLNKTQDVKVEEFVNKTGATRNLAISFLKDFQWDVASATMEYRANPYPKLSRNPSSSKTAPNLEALFRRYKAPYEDMIMAEGIDRLCTDLGLDPQDIVMLVVSWHMKAATMCEYSKQEFMNGLKTLKIDSNQSFLRAVPALRAELRDKGKFAEIYNFAFDWAKEKGQKSLQLETAVGMWQLLFAEMTPKWPYVDHWCEFLEERHKLAIPKDTWSQLLDFVRDVDPSLSNFDTERYWPYLVEDFVDYLKEKNLVQNS